MQSCLCQCALPCDKQEKSFPLELTPFNLYIVMESLSLRKMMRPVELLHFLKGKKVFFDATFS